LLLLPVDGLSFRASEIDELGFVALDADADFEPAVPTELGARGAGGGGGTGRDSLPL